MSASRDPEFESLKLPPHSLEAEQSVLGGLLLDNSAWDKIIDILKESDIYREDHRLIFRHIGQLISAGSIIVRQRGTKFHPSKNVGIGKDHTIFAKVDGYVEFSVGGEFNRSLVSIIPAE